MAGSALRGVGGDSTVLYILHRLSRPSPWKVRSPIAVPLCGVRISMIECMILLDYMLIADR